MNSTYNRRLHYISNDNRLSTFNSVLLHYIVHYVETFIEGEIKRLYGE